MIKKAPTMLALAASIVAASVVASKSQSPEAMPADSGSSAAITCALTVGADPANKRNSLRLERLPSSSAATYKGYLREPLSILRAIKTCSGGNPIDVTWESWRGTTRVSDVWFLNTSNVELSVYDSDPLGLRVWKGVVGPTTPGLAVSFNELSIDIRSVSDVDVFSKGVQNGYLIQRLDATRYAHTYDTFIAYASASIMIQYQCYSTSTYEPVTPWANWVSLTTDSLGRTEDLYIPIAEDAGGRCLGPELAPQYRYVLSDTAYIWGQIGRV